MIRKSNPKLFVTYNIFHYIYQNSSVTALSGNTICLCVCACTQLSYRVLWIFKIQVSNGIRPYSSDTENLKWARWWIARSLRLWSRLSFWQQIRRYLWTHSDQQKEPQKPPQRPNQRNETLESNKPVDIQGAYKASDYASLPVSNEVKELFKYISRYDILLTQIYPGYDLNWYKAESLHPWLHSNSRRSWCFH